MHAALRPLLLLSLSACGSAAAGTYDPPYLTLNGTLTSSVAAPSEVRVALVWALDPKTAPSSSFRVAQEIDVRAEFPAGFRIDVRALPPPEAMIPLPSTASRPGVVTAYAFGTLVVYEDANHDGKLDLITSAASPDRVLGAPERLEILYLEGGGIPKNPNAPPTDEDSLEHGPGFNLILEPERAPLEPGCAACGAPVGAWTRLPLEADIAIALTADPQLSRAICARTGSVGVSSGGNCQPCVGDACASCPIPQGANVICSADRTAFVAHSCTSESVCADLSCATVSGTRDPASPAPTGWPCP